MSRIEDHIRRSFECIEEYAKPSDEQRKILDKMIPELHEWMDEYDGKKGEGYDYTGINCMKHREKRHHVEGAREAEQIFSKKYGKDFKDIIMQEAGRHIMDDWGFIPFAFDYAIPGFWKENRGF